ncbi:TPRXL isoform X1 [Olea europaea subsp. europaea]|uniref:TPRXL isoform X1 n=2 Tax=Olea europaea subsp. europaea TaxID=158383 RepID=A0A8S0RVR7_OLEEU|nr:TPRXL isoform X1 [Olea europaea subsp. europaea]
MISDSIHNASMPLASSNTKDYAKKRRVNRSAKLKQCKLDARRDQWLSHAKNNGVCTEEVSGGGGTRGVPSAHLDNERGRLPTEKLEIKPTSVEENYGDGSSMHHYNDLESSPANSLSSYTSVLCSNDSGINFTGSGRCSSQSSIGSTNGCFSGSMSEDNEGDDWEAVADALAATNDKQKEHSLESISDSLVLEKHVISAQSDSRSEISNLSDSGVEITESNPESEGDATHSSLVNCRAWRPNDAFRPRGLPSLSKQHSFPLNSELQFGRVASVWGCKIVQPVPTSCPICCEDLDFTDSTFIPCSCGFRLCLFCHKRILEEDGRCPGCRNKYDCEPVEGEETLDGGSLTFRLARSCSMILRS